MSAGILSFLARWCFDIWNSLNKAKRQEARTAYLKFRDAFTPFVRHLEMNDVNLNNLITDTFREHDDARRNYIWCLKLSVRERFDAKWKEYKEQYDQVGKLEELRIARDCSPFDNEKIATHKQMYDDLWEKQDERRKNMPRIINELLDVAEIKL